MECFRKTNLFSKEFVHNTVRNVLLIFRDRSRFVQRFRFSIERFRKLFSQYRPLLYPLLLTLSCVAHLKSFQKFFLFNSMPFICAWRSFFNLCFSDSWYRMLALFISMLSSFTNSNFSRATR